VLPDRSGIVPDGLTAFESSSDPLVGELLVEITDQRGDGEADTQRRLEDQPRSRLEDSACGSVVPGSARSIQFRSGAALRRSDTSGLVSERVGGDEETRTPDPLLAKETLCQLSYVPRPSAVGGGRFWTRTRDLCLIRAVL
jgi:hypothetical protein